MPTFHSPQESLNALAERLSIVGIDHAIQENNGRVLAEPILADRDSPAADVSAMDGYAVLLDDLKRTDGLSILGESAPGAPPPSMQSGSVVRIFTGAMVPQGAEAVVKREDTLESPHEIHLKDSARLVSFGENIRRAGENAKAGSVIFDAGMKINATHRAVMANFGFYSVKVFSPVKVSIITTGDEVGLFQNELPKPWQLRNSNRVALTSLLDQQPWIEIISLDHCLDDRSSMLNLLTDCLKRADAILLTGGVSMGDYDYVPEIVKKVQGEILFHGLPIRPGKPILGASTAEGKLILGLPGNPVSAMIGCRRFALPLLAKMSGKTDWLGWREMIRLENAGSKSLPLYWLRLVHIIGDGVAEPVTSQGSGDLVSMGQSSGFVEIPPGNTGDAFYPYFTW